MRDRLRLSDKIAISGIIFSILVAILLGIYSARISMYISKQSVDIKGFDSLLYNSKRTIDTLNVELQILKHQLALNEISQNVANKNAEYLDEANMNLFSSSIYRLGEIINQKKEIFNKDSFSKTLFITGIKEILLSQLNNTYLLKNDTLNIVWVKAYTQLFYYEENPKGSFSNKDFDNSFDTEKEKHRIDEIKINQPGDIGSCWDAANKAYVMGLKYLKKDKRFQKYN